ncbi:TPA: hypothetical protein ACHOZC_003386 [Raoultella ornithinolytica]
MGKNIKFVSFDPALRNFGFVTGLLNIETLQVSEAKVSLIETAASNKKSVRTNSDDLRRAQEIWKGIKPLVDSANIVFAELPVGSQSSRAQTSYGICIGILACTDKPIIQLTPNDIKQYIGGKKDTAKAEIIEWAVSKHPDAGWFTKKVKGETSFVNKNEHPADALAAVYAGLETDQFKQAAEMMRAFL